MRTPHAPCVLIADDEEMLLSLSARIFERAGFRATTARSSGEVLSQLSDGSGAGPDAMVLDYTIPPAGGSDLVHKVLELAPNLPIVLTSGDHLPAEARGLLDPPRIVFLAKPFAPNALIDTVRGALASV